jgi:hypothetical protein
MRKAFPKDLYFFLQITSHVSQNSRTGIQEEGKLRNISILFLKDSRVLPGFGVANRNTSKTIQTLMSSFIKGIVSPDWKGLQMVSLDRFEV